MPELVYLRSQAGPTLVDPDAVAIGDLYRRSRASMIDSVRYLVDAGLQLIAKKASLSRGEWLPWLKDNENVLGFKERAARLMMKGAKWFEANRQLTTDLNEIGAVQFLRLAWGNNDGLRGTRGTGDNQWFTPAEYVDAARAVLGEIDLDPASHPLAQEWIQAKEYFIADALDREWYGRVWLNPPYARDLIDRFANKMIEEINAGRISAAIMLTHNYTDTNWFQLLALHAAAICFAKGRIKFIDDDGDPCNPTQGQAFLYFGTERDRFATHFGQLGFIAIPF